MNLDEIAASRGCRFIKANGIDIAYRDIGSGPPLILLTGAWVSTGPVWSGSPFAHVDFLDDLSRHFRVIAPDTRGTGATRHTGGPATFDVLTADVIALIDVLELDRPALAGFREGGATATLIALAAPDRISALVNHAGFDYFDPPCGWVEEVRSFFGGSPDAIVADPDLARRGYQTDGVDSDFFRAVCADHEAAQEDEHWRAYISQIFDRMVAPFGATLDDLSGIAVPTLVLCGDRDHFCPVEMAVRFYRTVPQSELAIIPGTGHLITPLLMHTLTDFLLRQQSG